MPRPEISVLLPVRGDRMKSLYRSMMSLLANAADSTRVDFWLALDPEGNYKVSTPGAAQVKIWSAPEAYGPWRMHEYYNAMAGMAEGKWLMIWCDSAFMKTKGWDAVIVSQPDAVLRMSVSGRKTYPVWPRRWTRATGYVSQSPRVGRWVLDAGALAGSMRNIPVEAHHDPRMPRRGLADVRGVRYYKPEMIEERVRMSQVFAGLQAGLTSIGVYHVLHDAYRAVGSARHVVHGRSAGLQRPGAVPVLPAPQARHGRAGVG